MSLFSHKVELDDFYSRNSKRIKGKKKKVKRFMRNTIRFISNKKTDKDHIDFHNDDNVNFRAIFLMLTFYYILNNMNKVYDKNLMRVSKWLYQQLLLLNNFRLSLVEINKYLLKAKNKKKLYKTMSMYSDILISKYRIRPFINHSIYSQGMRDEGLFDYFIFSLMLATNKKKGFKFKDFKGLNENYNLRKEIEMLGRNIRKRGVSELFRIYLLCEPNLNTDYNKREMNRDLYIGLLSLQFTRFILNNEDIDEIYFKISSKSIL